MKLYAYIEVRIKWYALDVGDFYLVVYTILETLGTFTKNV